MLLIKISLCSSILIVCIIIIRALLLYKLPQRTFNFLWFLVIIKLLCPISIPFKYNFISIISRVNSNRKLDFQKHIDKLIHIADESKASDLLTSNTFDIYSTNFSQINFLEKIILLGILLSLSFFLIMYIKHYIIFRKATTVNNTICNEWLSKHKLFRKIEIKKSNAIKSPLTYGIFNPVNLLPTNIEFDDEKLQLILLHEFIHIKYFHQLSKIILVITLCIHWFNPIVWAMFFLANRDIELFCDQKVIKTVGNFRRKDYAYMLIHMAEKSKCSTVNYFNNNCVKERIIMIIKKKDSGMRGYIWGIGIVLAISIVFASNYESNTIHPLDSGKEVLYYLFYTADEKLENDVEKMQNDLDLTDKEIESIKKIALNEYLNDNETKSQYMKNKHINNENEIIKFNKNVHTNADLRNEQLIKLFKEKRKTEDFRNWIAKWWEEEREYRNKIINMNN